MALKRIPIPEGPKRKEDFKLPIIVDNTKKLDSRPKKQTKKKKSIIQRPGHKYVNVYACGHINPIEPKWHNTIVIYLYHCERCPYCDRPYTGAI